VNKKVDKSPFEGGRGMIKRDYKYSKLKYFYHEAE
jgi:hypothetical protein